MHPALDAPADEVKLAADFSCSELRTLAANLASGEFNDVENGWSRPSSPDDQVCAASFLAYNLSGQVTDQRCQKGTVEEAERICHINGARLCTANELIRHTTATGVGDKGGGGG
jgi:hypothetical protein